MGNDWSQPQYNRQQTMPTFTPQQFCQFMWVNGPGVVEMYPVAAGSEMTFIDSENQMLYVKRTDEYGHPLKTRRFKLEEIVEAEQMPQTQAIPVDDWKNHIDEMRTALAGDMERMIDERFRKMFTPPITAPVSNGGAINA